MPKRHKPTITVDEHLAFGRACKAFQKALGKMATGNENGLGMWRFGSSSPQCKAIRRAQLALQNLKLIMDNEVCGAIGYHEPYGRDTTHFYYGDEDPRPDRGI